MMKLKMMTEPSDPPVGGEPAPPPQPMLPAKSRKRLYTVLGVICIAVLVSAIVLVFLVPRGLGETIPYGFNYTAGEKMTYNMSESVSSSVQSSTENGTVDIEVLSYDGANYTMNETTAFTAMGSTQQFSFTVKMDKTGRILEVLNLPPEMQQLYSVSGMLPGFGLPSNKTAARVGETWQIPLNLNYSGLTMSGTINYKFGDIKNITVPAGTYKAFKIDFSTENVHVSGPGASISMSYNGQLYLEYGSCRLIDINMQVTETLTTTQTMTVSMNMQMELIQHIKP